MTEQEAIERIRRALAGDAFKCRDVRDELKRPKFERLATAAWNEMKAISAELAEKHGTSPKVFIDAQLDALQ